MAHREFRDEDGRAWEVWDVHPFTLSSVLTPADVATQSGLDSHLRSLTRLDLPVELRDGWLAFRCAEDARRLAPIPTSWVGLADRDLALLVHTAKPNPKLTSRL